MASLIHSESPEKVLFGRHCEEVDTTDVAISNLLLYIKARLRSLSRAKSEIASPSARNDNLWGGSGLILLFYAAFQIME